MSTKIFTNLIFRNLRNPKHFHLYPSRRTLEKNIFFTKFGDSGKSKIYSGELFKDHLIFETIGATEELNAYIGLATEYIKDNEQLMPVAEKLRMIQLVLVDIMDIICYLHPKDSSVDKSKPPVPLSTAKVSNKDIAALESLITHYGTLLPSIEKVIIPGSGKACAALHVARAVSRRCERILVTAFKDMEYDDNIIKFMNRLSTYLLQAARISAKFSNKVEVIYKPHLKGDGTISDK